METIPSVVLLLIPILTGSVGIPVINWLKARLGWTKPEDKTKNIWLAFGVSLLLAVGALLITSSFAPLAGPETVVTWVAVAFSTATLIYKSLQPVEDPQEPEELHY